MSLNDVDFRRSESLLDVSVVLIVKFVIYTILIYTKTPVSTAGQKPHPN